MFLRVFVTRGSSEIPFAGGSVGLGSFSKSGGDKLAGHQDKLGYGFFVP